MRYVFANSSIARNYACTTGGAQSRTNTVGFAAAVGADTYGIDAAPSHRRPYPADDRIVAGKYGAELLAQARPLIDGSTAAEIACDLYAPGLRFHTRHWNGGAADDRQTLACLIECEFWIQRAIYDLLAGGKIVGRRAGNIENVVFRFERQKPA